MRIACEGDGDAVTVVRFGLVGLLLGAGPELDAGDGRALAAAEGDGVAAVLVDMGLKLGAGELSALDVGDGETDVTGTSALAVAADSHASDVIATRARARMKPRWFIAARTTELVDPYLESCLDVRRAVGPERHVGVRPRDPRDRAQLLCDEVRQ